MPDPEIQVTIVGAGVIGLAVADQTARPDRRVLLLERNSTFGQEISSRHSGVIHAGIYAPGGSLKATLCVRGRRQLYEICQKHSVPCKRLGKLVVAVEEGEVEVLENLLERGKANGVDGLRLLSRKEMKAIEPNVEGVAALLSPDSGIIDDHSLMRLFLGRAKENGAMVAFNKEVIGIEQRGGGYRLTIQERQGCFSFTTRVLINCAGLSSDRIAAMAGMDVERWGRRLHYCRGEYFRLARGKAVQRLVYPVPEAAGLGIHLTSDLEGRLRLGPNARYVNRVTYQVTPSEKGIFLEAARRYLPWVQYDDLEPEFAGVRPKLQGPGDGFRDFVISDEADKGFPGLINLIGIESPGLTCSPAIGETVASMVRDLL